MKKISRKTKPSPIESKIANLAQIAAELRKGKAFSVTRLTSIKSLCDDVTAAKEFALHFSKLAQEKMDRRSTPNHIDKGD